MLGSRRRWINSSQEEFAEFSVINFLFWCASSHAQRMACAACCPSPQHQPAHTTMRLLPILVLLAIPFVLANLNATGSNCGVCTRKLEQIHIQQTNKQTYPPHTLNILCKNYKLIKYIKYIKGELPWWQLPILPMRYISQQAGYPVDEL